jgi:hypothetical protein
LSRKLAAGLLCSQGRDLSVEVLDARLVLVDEDVDELGSDVVALGVLEESLSMMVE